jgi:hypothetical protein
VRKQVFEPNGLGIGRGVPANMNVLQIVPGTPGVGGPPSDGLHMAPEYLSEKDAVEALLVSQSGLCVPVNTPR